MCILLVEDEKSIREVIADTLASEGFEVCEAETGDQAAGLIEQPPQPFSLLITDVDLPGTRDGLGIARLMRTKQVAFPVIYMTGRPSRVGSLNAGEALLAKPFTLQDLLVVIHGLLADRQANLGPR